MAMGFNKVILAGYLTRDPELRYTQKGDPVCNVGLAINRTYMAGTEKREEVLFMNCTAWGKQGETIAQYMKKGSPMLVEGRLTSRDWEKKDGAKVTSIEVNIESCQFLPDGKTREGGAAPAARRENPPKTAPGGPSGSDFPSNGDEDVPF